MTIRRLDGGGDPYEFRDASRSLIIRGEHPEWVLQAAAEIIGTYSRLEGESLVDELTVMHQLGAANLAELNGALADQRRRFDVSPRCSISLGTVDYIWATVESPRLSAEVTAPKPLQLNPDMMVQRGADPDRQAAVA